MIKMNIKRPDGKSFTCYFPTLKDAKNFQDLVQTVVKNVRNEVNQNEEL